MALPIMRETCHSGLHVHVSGIVSNDTTPDVGSDVTVKQRHSGLPRVTSALHDVGLGHLFVTSGVCCVTCMDTRLRCNRSGVYVTSTPLRSKQSDIRHDGRHFPPWEWRHGGPLTQSRGSCRREFDVTECRAADIQKPGRSRSERHGPDRLYTQSG